MHLRAQLGTAYPRHGGQVRHRRADQRCANACPPRLGKHADPPDLAGFALKKQTRGAHRAACNNGKQVDRLAVQIVNLIRLAYPLFLDEHNATQGAAGGNIGRARDMGHAK